MKCHEFETRLSDVLDERTVPGADALLADHAGDCPACRQLLREHELLLEGVSALTVPRLSADFSQRVVVAAEQAAVSPQRGATTTGTWWMLAGVGAIAAAVLIAVTLGWPPRETQEPIAGEAETGAGISETDNLIEPALPQHSQAPQSLAFDPLSAFPRGDYGRHSAAALGNLAARLPEAVEQLDEMERFAPGIRPIRASFSMLFDALRWTIPGLAHEEPEAKTTLWNPVPHGLS